MGGRAGPGELEPLLAAVLEAEHTLVLGSDWTDGDLEPLFALLPPRLRAALTAETQAYAVPTGPLPRLLLTPLTDERALGSETAGWQHTLPRTQPDLSVHARDLAADLLALLASPDLLAEAHDTYERCTPRILSGADVRSIASEARGPAERDPLLPTGACRDVGTRSSELAVEIERLLRFARMAAARAEAAPRSALRVLGQAATGASGDGVHAELACLFDLLRDAFAPALIGEAVAGLIHDPRMPPEVLAFVMERMLAERSDPSRSWNAVAAADEFRHALRSLAAGSSREHGGPLDAASPERAEIGIGARPNASHTDRRTVFTSAVEGGEEFPVSSGGRGSADRDGSRRISTMLLLSAAADRDALAFATALANLANDDLELEQIARLGGVDAWAPSNEPAFAAVLHALSGAPPDVNRALDGLAELRHRLAPEPSLALIAAGLACVRRRFRGTPAEEWTSTLPLAAAVLRLCDAVTSGGITLDGRSGSELLEEMLHRAASAGRATSFDDHTDAELLLGLLGSSASRSRLAVWEIASRGDALVRAAMGRMRGDVRDGTQGSNEAVHWAIALLDRARRRELDPRYADLAKKLVAAAAGPAAPDLLRAYHELHSPDVDRIEKNTGRGEEGMPPPPLAGAVMRAMPPARASNDQSILAPPHAGRVEGNIPAPPPAGERVKVRGSLGRETAVPPIVRAERRAPRRKDGSRTDRRLSRLVQPDAQRPLAGAQRQRRSAAAALETRLAGLAKDAENRWRDLRSVGRSRRGIQAIRAAAALLIAIAIIGGALVVRRGGGGMTPVEAKAAASDAGDVSGNAAGDAPESPARAVAGTAEAGVPQAVTAVTAATGRGAAGAGVAPAEPAAAFAETMAAARAWGAAEEWDRVVGILSEGGPAWNEPESFAWDSLLAQAALRQAERLPAGDARRNPLLVTSRDRATLALASAAPFAEGSDLLRLLRAEACIIGPLDCEPATLMEDLLLAARSPHVAVSERAGELLESVKP